MKHGMVDIILSSEILVNIAQVKFLSKHPLLYESDPQLSKCDSSYHKFNDRSSFPRSSQFILLIIGQLNDSLLPKLLSAEFSELTSLISPS